jgi:hypothetical protein
LNAIGVVMVDLCWTGGLTAGRKIASLAETCHKPFAPHDCVGPAAFAAATHMSLSQANTLIQETVRAFYTGWCKELVTEIPTIRDGFVFAIDGTGLDGPSAFGVRAFRPGRSPERSMSARELFDLSGKVARRRRLARCPLTGGAPSRVREGHFAGNHARPRHRRSDRPDCGAGTGHPRDIPVRCGIRTGRRSAEPREDRRETSADGDSPIRQRPGGL